MTPSPEALPPRQIAERAIKLTTGPEEWRSLGIAGQDDWITLVARVLPHLPLATKETAALVRVREAARWLEGQASIDDIMSIGYHAAAVRIAEALDGTGPTALDRVREALAWLDGAEPQADDWFSPESRRRAVWVKFEERVRRAIGDEE